MVILEQLIFGNFGNISGDNRKSQMTFEFLQNDAVKILTSQNFPVKCSSLGGLMIIKRHIGTATEDMICT
jgi:hypothetical protein